MFEKLKQRRKEKERLDEEKRKAEFLAEVKRAKEKADAMLDTALVEALRSDVEKVCRAVSCCQVIGDAGECCCEACPFREDEECLSSLTDLAFNVVGFIGVFIEGKRNAKICVNENGEWRDVETD